MAQHLKALENRFGYRFRDKQLLRQALTPPSAGLPIDNQRLEFMGDSVLQLCSTRLVYEAHRDWKEGHLSKLRGKIVSTDSLKKWAKDLEITLERGPRSPKTKKYYSSKELADAIEALLAAVVLDSEAINEDGIKNAFGIVEKYFGEIVQRANPKDWEHDDPKTALQERVATMGLVAPEYELIERSGPDHAPVFSCRARVGKFEVDAKGTTLKRAQMEAARILMGQLSASFK
ncbi:MAG: putative dsRNA-binding protein [Holophagaceae bacterium]|nr:putative dsRNA-binding protein [Holophagaceae bacterium]